MKKIEIIQRLEVLPDKHILIITRYPKWLGWLVKLINVYIAPHTHNPKMKINIKTLTPICSPSFVSKIDDIA